jgi:hypothetical protein
LIHFFEFLVTSNYRFYIDACCYAGRRTNPHRQFANSSGFSRRNSIELLLLSSSSINLIGLQFQAGQT